MTVIKAAVPTAGEQWAVPPRKTSNTVLLDTKTAIRMCTLDPFCNYICPMQTLELMFELRLSEIHPFLVRNDKGTRLVRVKYPWSHASFIVDDVVEALLVFCKQFKHKKG